MARPKSGFAIVSVNIPTGLRDFIEDARWAERMEVSDVVTAALTDWAVARGYKTQPSK